MWYIKQARRISQETDHPTIRYKLKGNDIIQYNTMQYDPIQCKIIIIKWYIITMFAPSLKCFSELYIYFHAEDTEPAVVGIDFDNFDEINRFRFRQPGRDPFLL
jgi:hypothetical protein